MTASFLQSVLGIVKLWYMSSFQEKMVNMQHALEDIDPKISRREMIYYYSIYCSRVVECQQRGWQHNHYRLVWQHNHYRLVSTATDDTNRPTTQL